MDESPDVVRRRLRFDELDGGLRGLFFFADQLERAVNQGDPQVMDWSRWAYYTYASMLFIDDKANDVQPGAALRALRDLGCDEQADALKRALAVAATPNGRSLAQTIETMRNAVLIHHSFEIERQGPALTFLGEPSNELVTGAFDGLLDAVRRVVDEISAYKPLLMQQIVEQGLVRESFQAVDTATPRARERERRRREAQTMRDKSKLGPGANYDT